MNRKGQAAMEFLMTYGWAIIVVLAAIAALAFFGVLNPSNLLPEQTTFQSPIPNVDRAIVAAGAANAGTVTIAFRNNAAATINVTDITGATDDCGGVGTGAEQISIDGGAYAALPGTVTNGQLFSLRFTCASALTAGDRFSSDVKFDYTNQDTKLTRPHEGSVKGKVV